MDITTDHYKTDNFEYTGGWRLKWFSGVALGLWVENLTTKLTYGNKINFVFVFFEISYTYFAVFPTLEDKERFLKKCNITLNP